MSDDSTNKLLAYIEALYVLSQRYGALDGNSSAMVDTNRRVMEWLRSPKYNDVFWTALVGSPDTKFIKYVNEHRKDANLDPVPDFEAPFTPGPVRVRTPHWGATLNGVFVRGLPPSATGGSGSLIGRGDVSGWGGDLITFYGEWIRDSAKEGDGYNYCQKHLFHDNTTFKMQDLVEDVDAFNIAMRLRNDPNLSVSEATTQYYSGAAQATRTRYRDFWTMRFGTVPTASSGPAGVLDTATRNAIAMLKDISDKTIVGGRDYLIWRTKYGGVGKAVLGTIGQGPFGPILELYAGPSDDEIIKFCRGFRDVVLAMILMESTGQPAHP